MLIVAMTMSVWQRCTEVNHEDKSVDQQTEAGKQGFWLHSRPKYLVSWSVEVGMKRKKRKWRRTKLIFPEVRDRCKGTKGGIEMKRTSD